MEGEPCDSPGLSYPSNVAGSRSGRNGGGALRLPGPVDSDCMVEGAAMEGEPCDSPDADLARVRQPAAMEGEPCDSPDKTRVTTSDTVARPQWRGSLATPRTGRPKQCLASTTGF